MSTTLKDEIGEALDAEAADELGLVTFTPDDIDWEDEVRLAIEERAGFSPDGLIGMEANLRFAGPETMETKIFARLSAWQNWIFQRPNATGPEGALKLYGTGKQSEVRPEAGYRRTIMAIDYSQRIPNNVDLSSDRRLQRALENWQPRFLDWWKDMGPDGTSDSTSICAPRSRPTPTAGPTSATSRCRTIAGASSSPTAIPTARSPSATTRASRPGRTCRASFARPCAA